MTMPEFDSQEFLDRFFPVVDHSDIVNGFFTVRQTFSKEDSWRRGVLYRTVTGISFESKGYCVDLIKEAPDGTVFKTSGVVKIDFKDGTKVPLAFCGVNDDGNLVVTYHPDIMSLGGGVLPLMHEIGHCWQDFAGISPDSRTAQYLLSNFNNKTSDQLKLALKEVEESENFAWRFALARLWTYQEVGINLAPELTPDQLDVYPQRWLDLYTQEYHETIEMTGSDFAFKWRSSE